MGAMAIILGACWPVAIVLFIWLMPAIRKGEEKHASEQTKRDALAHIKNIEKKLEEYKGSDDPYIKGCVETWEHKLEYYREVYRSA